jgi:hypothetical protein
MGPPRGAVVRTRRQWCGIVALVDQKLRITTTTAHRNYTARAAEGSSSSLHTPDYLSVKQALEAAHSAHLSASSSNRGGAAGLTFTLPPLCVWGASLHFPSVEESHEHTPRSSLSSTSAARSRFASIWSPVEAYLSRLHGLFSQGSEEGGVGMSFVAPPVWVALRLFPDLTVAQMPTTFLHTPHSAPEWKEQQRESSRACRRRAASHEQPLQAILAMDEPWGSGADPRQVFRHAIDGLREVGQRLLPQVPLILQLPTRLLVSQQFLDDLATMLVRSGWRSVAFELPSTHQLLCPFQAPSLDGRGGSKASPCAGEGSQLPSAHDNGAADAAWCRLPLLCTSWATLCRHPSLGPTLRHLRRHDVVPFHVLFAWATTEAKLFHTLERSLVVDVTAPMPGAEMALAVQQSPDSVGISADEAYRAALLARSAAAHSSLGPAYPTAEEEAEEENAAVFSSLAHSAKPRRVFMTEHPATSRSLGVALSSGVADAVRRCQCNKLTQRDNDALDAAAVRSSNASINHAEVAWRRMKKAPPTCGSPPQTSSSTATLSADQADAAPLLILDAPPDHLRVLIEKSIAKNDAVSGSAAPSLTPRQRLLQRVGQFMQHTLKHDADKGAEHEERNGADSTAATVQVEKDAVDELMREAEELEELLRQANDASDTAAASANVEHMMVEMHRYMCAHERQDGLAGSPDASASPKSNHYPPLQVLSGNEDECATTSFLERNEWLRCAGYWDCVKTLVFDVAQADLLWTLPTYNAAAVRSWSEAFTSMCKGAKLERSTARSTTEPPSTLFSALPPVVPVWEPLQSVMQTEVGRLLREGYCFPQPPQQQRSPTHVAAREEESRTWLPRALNAALQDALAQLSDEVRAQERRRLLSDYRLLREEGAQGARRGSCEILRGDAADLAAAVGGSSVDTADLPTCPGTIRSSEQHHDHEGTGSEEDDEPAVAVRIRVRRGACPFGLLTPSQVEVMESKVARRRLVEAAEGATESDSSDCAPAAAQRATVQEVNDVFMSKVEEYYGSAAFTHQSPQFASLHITAPGLDATALRRSWHAIS